MQFNVVATSGTQSDDFTDLNLWTDSFSSADDWQWNELADDAHPEIVNDNVLNGASPLPPEFLWK